MEPLRSGDLRYLWRLALAGAGWVLLALRAGRRQIRGSTLASGVYSNC